MGLSFPLFESRVDKVPRVPKVQIKEEFLPLASFRVSQSGPPNSLIVLLRWCFAQFNSDSTQSFRCRCLCVRNEWNLPLCGDEGNSHWWNMLPGPIRTHHEAPSLWTCFPALGTCLLTTKAGGGSPPLPWMVMPSSFLNDCGLSSLPLITKCCTDTNTTTAFAYKLFLNICGHDDSKSTSSCYPIITDVSYG